jgi:hypothetical protein
METACVCDWANPRFANLPEGMDLCAAIMGEAAPLGGEDAEDEDYVPSETTDTSDSESDLAMNSESDGDGDSSV